MEHASQVFARLVCALFGGDAVATAKTAAGPSLVVLGVQITISKKGFKCRPSEQKLCKWLRVVEDAVDARILHPGAASKLAGKLRADIQKVWQAHVKANS